MALDLRRYLMEQQLDSPGSKITILGQSMGGKIGMTFACLFPHLVDGLVSIDSPPVDRNPYPHLNSETNKLVRDFRS